MCGILTFERANYLIGKMGKCEQEIVALIKVGERVMAFEAIVECYQQQLYWHIRRLVVSHEDAQDVLQESMMNAFRALDRFENRSSIYTWLYRIATNEALKLLKSKKIDGMDLVESLRGMRAEGVMSEEEILFKFQEAIALLPYTQRNVFNMRYYDEMSYEDMSKVLNISVDSLKTNYHYATKKIKESLIK